MGPWNVARQISWPCSNYTNATRMTSTNMFRKTCRLSANAFPPSAALQWAGPAERTCRTGPSRQASSRAGNQKHHRRKRGSVLSVCSLFAVRAGSRLLHYALTGKQTPGMAGASPPYLFSPKFLQGHGGWKSIVWVSPKIAPIMGKKLPDHVEPGRDDEQTSVG